MEVSREKKRNSIVLYFSIVSSVLFILINIFRWHLIEIFTVFLEPFLELFIVLVFLISMILSIVYFIRNVRKERYRSIIPFSISIITILIIWFVPFTNIILEIDFKMNLKDREKVVSMIQTGELVPDISYNESLITLPKGYAHLSKGGGQVVVEREGEKLKVLFFTFRGILDNFSGFTYISDNSELQKGSFNADLHQVRKKKDNWYWISSK